MLCLEVQMNDEPPRFLGIAGATILSAHTHGYIGAEEAAAISLTGMCNLGDGREAHVYWCLDAPLRTGESVSIRLAEVDTPTAYEKIVPTDSLEYQEEQRWLQAEEATPRPSMQPAERLWTGLLFSLAVDGEVVQSCSYGSTEEHFLCAAHWDVWQPERLRVFARTFVGQRTDRESQQTEWLRVNLTLGHKIVISLNRNLAE